MTDLEKRLLKALRDGNLFDFLSTYGHELSKDQLVRVAMEQAYGLYQAFRSDEEMGQAVNNGIADEIQERWE